MVIDERRRMIDDGRPAAVAARGFRRPANGRRGAGGWEFVTLQPNEVTPCVMRKKGEGEKWKRLTDVTADLSGAAIARFHFSPFSIFPLLTPRFRWLNSYNDG
jgi:hypothetical protein